MDIAHARDATQCHWSVTYFSRGWGYDSSRSGSRERFSPRPWRSDEIEGFRTLEQTSSSELVEFVQRFFAHLKQGDGENSGLSVFCRGDIACLERREGLFFFDDVRRGGVAALPPDIDLFNSVGLAMGRLLPIWVTNEKQPAHTSCRKMNQRKTTRVNILSRPEPRVGMWLGLN